VKQYLGHKNQEYCVEGLFVKSRRTQAMQVVIGGEDGRLCGWDLNTQEQVIDSQVESREGPVKLVSTIDHEPKFGIIAASGNFKGLYMNYLSKV
jgi:hypothetical protein